MSDIDTQVRVITDGGELVDITAYTDSDDAWNAFEAVIPLLKDGEIAQLIEDDLIAAAFDVTEYI